MLSSSTSNNMRSVEMVDNVVYNTMISIYLLIDSDSEVESSVLKALKIAMINYPDTLVIREPH